MSLSTRILNWMAGGLLLFTWVVVARNFAAMPPTIPIHFEANGQPDNWAPKAGIWVLPIMASIGFGIFSLLYRYAHRLPMKGDNSEKAFSNLRMLFLQLRLATALVMAAGVTFSVRAAMGQSNGEPGAMVPFIILVMFTPTLLFLFRTLKAKPGKSNG